MQQLTIEHKKVTSNKYQRTETQVEENMRERKGTILALSRRVLRIVGSDTFYCKSESRDIYHFIKYMPSVFEWCSCEFHQYNSIKHIKCKHIFAVEYSIRKGTLQYVEKLPKEVKRDNMVPITESYRDDSYDF
jgi:hypothetical protein